MNNIEMLKQDIKERQDLAAKEAAENFSPEDMELTEHEREILEQAQKEQQTVVVETAANGTQTMTPVEEYAAPLDAKIQTLPDHTKLINVGDIEATARQIQEDVKSRVAQAYRDMAVVDEDMSDEDIMEINAKAIATLQKELGVERITSEELPRLLRKYSLKALCDILPEKFVHLYVTPSEISAVNMRARERLIDALSYFVAAGPEMDYLNEYIDHENRLMMVSERIIRYQTDYVATLRSPEKLSDIVAKAKDIEPEDNSIWARYIKNDPKRAHSDFAQRIVVYQEYEKAYAEMRKDYLDDPKALELVDEQIEECQLKQKVYRDVFDLALFRSQWDAMFERYKANRKTSGNSIFKDAQASFETIRRSKQNLPFPVFDEKYLKRPRELFRHYVEDYPVVIKDYNESLRRIRALAETDNDDGESAKRLEEIDSSNIRPLTIDGVDEDTLAQYYTVLLVIGFARLVKKLTDRRATKYDAIMLDAYFRIYCRLGVDIYLMEDVWQITKPMVEYAIKNWPLPRRFTYR